MRIKIADVNKTPMWAMPAVEKGQPPLLFLSLEQNEWIDVDYSKMTMYQKQMIWAAIKMKTLLSEDDAGFQADFKAGLQNHLDKRQKTQTSQLKQIFGISSEENKQAVENVKRVNEIKKILENSVATINRLIASFSAADLEIAQKIEQLGKGRKGVMKTIAELIKKQAQANASKIVDPNAPTPEEFQDRQFYRGQNRSLLSNVSGVVESEVEEFIIKI